MLRLPGNKKRPEHEDTRHVFHRSLAPFCDAGLDECIRPLFDETDTGNFR